jgi:hypothetical protein
MKDMHIAISSMFAMSTFSLHAAAGPDWSVIQDAREMSSRHKIIERQSPEKQAMPIIDHGPRALSTAWLNKPHQTIAPFSKTVSASR